MTKRIAFSALSCAFLLAGALSAQPVTAGIDYPAPYPVPFVGYTTSTADPNLCVPGFSPWNFRSDLAVFKFCSARNVWSISNSSNAANTGTTAAFTGTLSVTGVTTPTGGVAQATATVPFTQFMSPQPILAALSTSQTDFGGATTGNMALTELFIPTNATLTGVCMLMGSGASTDKWLGVLYNSAGTALANSAVAGVTLGTASTLNCQAFLATQAVVGPQTYYIGIQTNGTTANEVFLYNTGSLPTNYGCGQVTDTFGTIAAAVVPTTFTTAKCGPVSVY